MPIPIAKFRPYPLWLLMALLLFGSCASMKGQNQSLIIATDVEKVDIYGPDKTFLGQAPGFITINRESSAELTLKHEGLNRVVKLDTKYRWSDSFWPGLILGLMNPALGLISWGTDFLSGAAWNYQPPELIHFKPNEELDPPPPKKIAVAPVAYDSELISDQLSFELAEFAKKLYPKAEILPYEPSSAHYSAWGWNHEFMPEPDQRNQIFRRLDADHLLIAKATKTEDAYEVRAKLHDIYRDHTSEKFLFERNRADMGTLDEVYSFTREFFYEVVPNSIGIERSTSTIPNTAFLDYGEATLISKNEGLLGSQLAISLLNLRPPQTTGRMSVFVGWQSKFSLIARQFELSIDPNLDSPYLTKPTDLTWLGLQAGIGGELGLDTPAGLFYWNAVPILQYDYLITDAKNYPQGSETSFNIYTEVGYAVYLSDRIHLQLFFSALSFPDILKKAIEDIYDSPIHSNHNLDEYAYTGISLSYFFPEGRTRIKRSIRNF